MDVTSAQALWDPLPGWLNTASYGLPPRPAFDAMQSALADWRQGRISWETWGESTEAARRSFAGLVGAAAEDVAIGSNVSSLLGLVAAALPAGARVVVPEVEFTSNLFPWLVQESRGVEVVVVPLDRLADAVDRRTTLVAYSAVQSATGEVTDMSAVASAARHSGALVAVDATQACGWLPVDVAHADFLACSAYKWLMSPRGTAFLYVAPDQRDRLPPLAAGWYAGEDVHSSYYGPPLRLARDARRFDVSPAWFSWVGTAPALGLVAELGVASIHDHDVGLANRFLAGLNRPPRDSAIVTVDVPDAAERLDRAGIRAAVRAGALRASFHVYSTERDVDDALTALLSPLP